MVNIGVASTLLAEKSNLSNPYSVTLQINDANVNMEIDTGASVSLIPYSMYQKHFSNVKLLLNVKFCSFTGDVVNCEDKMEVNVKHFGQTKRMWLHVLGTSKFALLGGLAGRVAN